MSSGGSNGSNIYQYGNSGTADAGSTAGAQQIAQQGTQNQGLYNSSVGGLAGLTGGSNYTTQQGVNAGNYITGSTAGLNLPGAAAGALQAGSNANSGLYNQELQQTNDQLNSALSQRGIASTPYGAGVQALGDQTFNNNWNTQQVGLQNTAANTASTLLGANNNGVAQGQSVAQGAANNPLSALASLLGSGNASTADIQSAVTDFLGYLSGGTSASSAQATAANQQAAAENSGLGGLGSLFGTLATGGAGGNGLFSLFNSTPSS